MALIRIQVAPHVLLGAEDTAQTSGHTDFQFDINIEGGVLYQLHRNPLVI
jgi:hypothetical protein